MWKIINSQRFVSKFNVWSKLRAVGVEFMANSRQKYRKGIKKRRKCILVTTEKTDIKSPGKKQGK